MPARATTPAGTSARAEKVGQIIKLDPRKTGEGETPLVWSVRSRSYRGGVSGVWATPAIYKDMLYVPTHGGALLGIDRQTGEIVWQKEFSEHAWGSPRCSGRDPHPGRHLRHAPRLRCERHERRPARRLGVQGAELEAPWSRPPPCGRALSTWARRDGYFYKFGDK